MLESPEIQDLNEISEIDIDTYMNTLKFDRNMISACNAIKDRIEIKFDMVVCIDGEEGIGKSTLGICLGWLLSNKFNLENNISYLPTTKEMENKFWAIKPKNVLLVDEAIKALYKLRFMDRFQTRINEMYATERWQQKITLLCIPRFTDLNEFFRNDRVKFWIHVVDRGLAVVFAKDTVNLWGNDRWHLKEEYKNVLYQVRRKKYVEITNEEKIAIYKKSQHFAFAFTFPMLPEEIEKEYNKKKGLYRKVPDDKEKSFKHSVILNADKLGIKAKDIATITGMDYSWIARVKRNNDTENKLKNEKKEAQGF
jgi:hypothetical protein